jgi:hypothetical protein
MNAVIPYLGANTALIGANTYGKPVGQAYLERPACDDRLRAIAFVTQNSQKQGDFYDGMASKFREDLRRPGRSFPSVRRSAGDNGKERPRFPRGRPCGPPISGGGGITAQEQASLHRELITPTAPGAVQREDAGFSEAGSAPGLSSMG